MHLRFDLFLQDHFSLSEDFLDMRTQLARFRIDDLELFLNADGEHVLVFSHRWGSRLSLPVRDQSISGRLKATDHHFAHPLMQFVAEREIVVPVLPEKETGKTNGRARLRRSRIKGPKIGREEPGPTEWLSARNCVDNYTASILSFSFQRDSSSFNQVKAARWFAFAQNHLPGIEFSWHCAKSEDFEVMWTHSLKKRVTGQPLFDVRVTNRMRFSAQFVGLAFAQPPDLRTVRQNLCRRGTN